MGVHAACSHVHPERAGKNGYVVTVHQLTRPAGFVPVSPMASTPLAIAYCCGSKMVVAKACLNAGLMDHLEEMFSIPGIEATLIGFEFNINSVLVSSNS